MFPDKGTAKRGPFSLKRGDRADPCVATGSPLDYLDMCVACVEFIKNKLNAKEFKSALREVARNDEAHLTEVEQVLQANPQDQDEARKKIADLTKKN